MIEIFPQDGKVGGVVKGVEEGVIGRKGDPTKCGVLDVLELEDMSGNCSLVTCPTPLIVYFDPLIINT